MCNRSVTVVGVDTYAALADPVRRRIVELLVRQPRSAGRVAEAFPHISRPAVSRHLRLLREAGLVHAQVIGRQRIHTADTGPLDEIEAWITGLRPGWDRHLDALETEVHRTRRQRERRERAARASTPDDRAPTTEERRA